MIETGRKKLETSKLSGFHKKRMTIDADYMSAFTKYQQSKSNAMKIQIVKEKSR